MAYRFDGVDDRVEFAVTPLIGATLSTATFAVFLKRTTLGTNDFLISLTEADGASDRVAFYASSGDQLRVFLSSNATGSSVSSSTAWYLLVATVNAGAVRYHVHDGTSWTHAADGSAGSSLPVDSSWRFAVGAKPNGANPFVGDLVCAGIKKTDSSDAAVETLSRTAFSAWRSFGFDWLAGFDASQEVGGILQDQATPGTGDEIAITGTTAVADAPGWVWGGGGGGAAAFVPRTIVIS